MALDWELRRFSPALTEPMLSAPVTAPSTSREPAPAPEASLPASSRSCGRWCILACFVPVSFLNAFMFMTFSVLPELSKRVLIAAAASPHPLFPSPRSVEDGGSTASPLAPSLSTSAIEWTYSISLLTVVLSMLPASHMLEKRPYATLLAATCLNVAGAWLRYASVAYTSYLTALASGVMLGGAAAIIMPAFAFVPLRWFASEQQPLAVAIQVQSNYAGWGLGTLIPLLVHDASSMRSFLWLQTALTTLTLPLFVALYHKPELQDIQEPQPQPELQPKLRPGLQPELYLMGASGRAASGSSHTLTCSTLTCGAVASRSSPTFYGHGCSYAHGKGYGHGFAGEVRRRSASLQASMRRSFCEARHSVAEVALLFDRGHFWEHTVAYGALSAISYTIPAIQTSVFAECMEPPLEGLVQHSMWLNFTFISCGVLAGLLIGSCVDEALEAHVIRALAVTCAVGLGAVHVLTQPAVLHQIGDGPLLLALLSVCLGVTGASSLGFLSLALRVVVRIGAPVPDVYCAGFTELMSYALAALLTQSSECPNGFFSCMVCAGAAALVLCFHARFPGEALGRVASSAKGDEPTDHQQGELVPLPVVTTDRASAECCRRTA